ncbi:MAG: BrnT family toxin [Pseudomonadota bacterium]
MESRGRIVVACWTPRGNDRRIISMRKANKREKGALSAAI